MTKKKGFWKNRHEREVPIMYEVTFEDGWIEKVLARSSYEARQKVRIIESDHGFALTYRPSTDNP
jgi:hypothetical protein